jgi:hypothetical protein
VVTSGPYAFIRHPGYSAGILILAASGVALGSWLAAAFLIAITVPFLLYRVINEDRVLQTPTGRLCRLCAPRVYANRLFRVLQTPTGRLCRLCAPRALAVGAGDLVIASRALCGLVKFTCEEPVRIRDIMEQRRY